MKFDKQETANIGLYYACYKLSLKGWNVMPTARNARGIDIIAYNKYGTQYIGVPCQQEIKMSTFQDSKMSPGG